MECFIKKYLQHGLIEPGYEKLSFTLGDRTYRADVLSDGTILDENSETFGDVPEWVHNAIASPGQILSIVKYGETPLSAFEQIFATTEMKPKKTNTSTEYEEENRRQYLLQDNGLLDINSDQLSPLPSPIPNVTPSLSSQQQQQQQQQMQQQVQHMNIHQHHHTFHYTTTNTSSSIQLSSSSSSSSSTSSLIRNNKNRYVTHLHNSLDYFKLGFEKGVFKSGKNNLRYKSDTIDVLSSLDEDCHVIDENNNYFETVIDWIRSINNRNNNNNNNNSYNSGRSNNKNNNNNNNNNNRINWKNLYYNDKNLSDYEDLILNGSKEKVADGDLEEEEEDDDDDLDDEEEEIQEEIDSGNSININNNNNLYYSNDKYRNETRPPESCYYNNEISSGSPSDKSDDNNNSNSINKLPSDDDEISNTNGSYNNNNHNNNMYFRNIQEKMEDFDDDYSFIDNTKEMEFNNNNNEYNDDLYKLIKQNQLSPGVDILELRYDGRCYRASLMKNGKIRSSDGIKYDDVKSWGRSLISQSMCVSDIMNSIYYKSSPLREIICESKNQPIVN